MEIRLLGWAGVQLRAGGSSLVIDPLQDAAAVWAFAGDRARGVALPEVVPAEPPGRAAAGLVTHLHRDHADAAALAGALAADAVVLLPAGDGGTRLEEAGLQPAAGELDAAGLRLEPLRPWEQREVDGWSVTAVPAADGVGDPQLSWLVTRGRTTIVHAGDTLMHGWWWRVAQRSPNPIAAALVPVNGARVDFGHRQPPSPLRAVMNAEEAAAAVTSMGARRMVPIHHGAYDFPGLYEPDPDPVSQLAALALDAELLTPGLGDWVDLAA